MSHFQTGDKGQRYEVRYIEVTTGREKVFGWTTEADGGAMMEAIKKWPAARGGFVVDRQGRDMFLEEDPVLPPGPNDHYPD